MPAGGLANTWAGFAVFILGLGIIAVIVFALLIWGGVELYSKHSPKDASTSTVE
jgi:ABC-type transport system involved in cytochrome c biogenesis permease subunit